jgi:hypothetical protein
MPITPYLKGPYYFDQETRRALGIALEMACIALSTGYDDDHVRRTIADELIALARTGERNPDVLCDKALEAVCRPEHNLEKPSTHTVGSAQSHWLVQHPLLDPSLLASGN